MARQTVRLFVVMLLIAFIPVMTSAEDQPSVDELAAALARYPALGDIDLPALDGGELQELLDGVPVVRISTGRSGGADEDVSTMGVVGLRIVDAPRLLVWLTVMGVASEPDVRLTRATLSRAPLGAYTRYQHVNLPWPVRDRHWLILCEKNIDLAQATDGDYWEHRWSLIDDGVEQVKRAHEAGGIAGLTAGQLDKSVYLPANRGAWALTELSPGKTLVIGYFDGSLGGLFPDGLVRRFTKLHLREGLNLVSELSTTVHREYSDNAPVHDGYGQPIRYRDVLRVARRLDPSAVPISVD
jgi:hypothetical protein